MDNNNNNGGAQAPRKRCPVKFAVMPAPGKLAGQIVPGIVEGSCTEKECVWWIESRGACAINVLADISLAAAKPAGAP